MRLRRLAPVQLQAEESPAQLLQVRAQVQVRMPVRAQGLAMERGQRLPRPARAAWRT